MHDNFTTPNLHGYGVVFANRNSPKRVGQRLLVAVVFDSLRFAGLHVMQSKPLHCGRCFSLILFVSDPFVPRDLLARARLCGLKVFVSDWSAWFTAEVVWHWCITHTIPRFIIQFSQNRTPSMSVSVRSDATSIPPCMTKHRLRDANKANLPHSQRASSFSYVQLNFIAYPP